MKQWNTVAEQSVIAKTTQEMQARGFQTHVVETKVDALELLKSLIPAQSEVMTGSSTTLDEIGFSALLESPESTWKSVHKAIALENDESKRRNLRRLAVTSQYFLSSVNAIAETGELVAVDFTGSRVGALPFAAEQVILVVGAQKITPTVAEAMERIREYVLPLEDKRAFAAYNMHSGFGKWVIIERELAPNRITVVVVKESLGF